MAGDTGFWGGSALSHLFCFYFSGKLLGIKEAAHAWGQTLRVRLGDGDSTGTDNGPVNFHKLSDPTREFGPRPVKGSGN